VGQVMGHRQTSDRLRFCSQFYPSDPKLLQTAFRKGAWPITIPASRSWERRASSPAKKQKSTSSNRRHPTDQASGLVPASKVLMTPPDHKDQGGAWPGGDDGRIWDFETGTQRRRRKSKVRRGALQGGGARWLRWAWRGGGALRGGGRRRPGRAGKETVKRLGRWGA